LASKHDVRWGTNGILPRPGAASFKRLLGCAILVLRIISLPERSSADCAGSGTPHRAPQRCVVRSRTRCPGEWRVCRVSL